MVVTCQTADTVTTVHGLEKGAKERNPIVRTIFETGGPAAFVAVKAGVTLLILHYHAVISTGVLATADVITCGAAVNNAVVASKLESKPPIDE